MTASPAMHSFPGINKFKLRPLPLTDAQRIRIQKLSSGHQVAIATMLNILSLAMPVMMLQVYDRIIPHQSYGTLVVLIVAVLVALTLDATLRVIRAWLVGWSAASYEHAASCAAVDHLTNAEIEFFDRSSAGEHLQNLTSLGRLREFYSGQAMTALIDLPFAAIYLIMIAYLGGVLVFIPIGLLAMFFISARFAGRQLKTALELRSASDDRKSSFVVSVLTSIHTAKAIAMEAPLMRKFEHAQDHVTQDSYRVALASGAATSLSATFGQLSLILTASAGCLLVLHGALSVGGLSACTMLAGRAIQPVQRVLGTWLRLQDLTIARRQAETLFSLPRQPRMKVEPSTAPEGHVTLEGVSFSYPAGAPGLLNDISLTMETGEVIAITGGKGSGKSTLLQLVAGLLTPDSGTIRVDDINPSTYCLSTLRDYIGYLPQEGTIFRGTIMENITGFQYGESFIERAREIGRELGLDGVVDLLPRGYQTVLNDTAADAVPPGIKQRIALARVLAKSPSLLLFDDADRTLDKEGYNRLFRMMGRLKGKCSMVLVSHDQNLLSFADRAFHLENGKLMPVTSSEGVGNLSHMSPRKDAR